MVATAMLALMISAAVPHGPARLRGLSPDAFDAGEPDRRAAIEARLRERADKLSLDDGSAGIAAGAAALQWPLQPAPGFTPFGYHGTGYFVDHDPRYPGLVQDYTCGERSYDLATGYNHRGTDYYLWPYPWLMMDLEQVRIVAAAPGVIIEKIDGNFDRDCAIQGNSGFNAVFVRQDDGLTAWYLHMKNGSTTSKAVGQRVEAGEFLGLVGSSGPSSLPHLHFELHDGAGNLVDPYHGACNAGPDRWAVFQPYEAPRIDTLSTHSAEPVLVDCGIEDGQPVHEDPHFSDRFAPGDTLWAFASYSDHRNGEITHFSVLRPDGALLTSWDFDLASENLPKPFYSGTAWDWSVTLPADAPPGPWILRAEFANAVYEHTFEVANPAALRRPGHSHHAQPPRKTFPACANPSAANCAGVDVR
jgi:murein DD-endopeptidase MepM/ murein hydrolase activator NlpD